MKRFSLLILSFFCLAVFCFCQSAAGGKPKTNLEIFEESISGELEKLIYSPGINRNIQFIFIVNPKEQGSGTNDSSTDETKFLTGLIKKTASANKLNFSFAKDAGSVKPDTGCYFVELQVLKLETKYTGFKKNRFLGEKTLSRTVEAKIAVNIGSNDQKFTLTDLINTRKEDEINFDGYESLESAQYYFTRSNPPDVSVFERILFPVLLISATAVTTILFFIIRSK